MPRERTSIVDQNVNPAKLGLDSLEEMANPLVLGDVNLDDVDAALSVRKLLLQFGDCFISLTSIARAEKDMVGL